MGLKHTNNGYATLSGNVLSTDLSISVSSVARLPTLAAGDFFFGTLVNTSNAVEHFLCTAIASLTLTVPAGGRGLGGTTALNWVAGDRVELRPISLTLDALQQEAAKSVTTASADGITYTATMSPVPIGYITNQIYFATINTANTNTAPTISFNSLGAKTIVKEGSAALLVGDMPTSHAAAFKYDGTYMVLLNAVPAGFVPKGVVANGLGLAGANNPALYANSVKVIDWTSTLVTVAVALSIIGALTAASLSTGNGAISGGAATFSSMSSKISMNPSTVSADVTIPAGYNAYSVGPLTIGEGVAVTLADNSNWSIL